MRVHVLTALFTCLILSGTARSAEETKSGTLGAKPITAAADVVAVLYDGADTISLSATGDVVAKLEELAKKSAKVQLTGTVDGKTMVVTKIVETEQKADEKDMKRERKGKKKDGEKKRKKKAEKNNN
ncbi:MAG TPA: hypothetical protein VEK08_16935 [Planctomycetota bacterium]|nr:hypothetical protein [Planctomycetota bacterium]